MTDANLDERAAARGWHAAKASEAAKYLKALAEANGGEIVAGGVPWGWNVSTSLRPVMDREALAEYLRGQQHDIGELLGDFGKVKVKKAIRDGWLPEDAFEEVPSGRTFGPKKSDDTDAAGEPGEGA